jgi:lysyl-tRNA synthetase, class II
LVINTFIVYNKKMTNLNEETKGIKSEKEIRLEKLQSLREKGIDPYPPFSSKTHTINETLAIKEGVVSIAGRIVAKRQFGKLTFCKIQDVTGTIQIVIKADMVGEDKYDIFSSYIDTGDIIEVKGDRGVTKTGEESVIATEWIILNKSLLALPDKFHGLQDKELRFRKRYLDLITNRDVFELFKTRSKILTLVRQFLNNSGFMEVETPVLQVLYGGTNAKPFKTNINAYDMDMYLRVAPELYLKRLLVGGYEKIYELGKNFRNEGVDQTHNPEFTMIEWYEAYIDYQGVMDRAEKLYKFIAQELFGKLELQIGEKTVDISHTWPRVTMLDSIKKYLNFDIEEKSDEEIQGICEKNNINIRGKNSRGQMIMEVFDKLVTPQLIDPIWIIDYPKEVSPLARVHRKDPRFVERFECYIMGKEIGDGWSEIIDPVTQRSRFENEQMAMKAGNDEAHPMDNDFIEALEYGMPPIGGIGVGIDRLVMLFTNKWSIREILFFPIMKPEQSTGDKE